MTTPQLTRTSEDSANAEASALNEARLRLIIDAVPGLVSYVDSDLRYRLANQTYTEWFGLDVSDLIGRSMQEMMGRVGFKAIRPHIERAFQGEIVTFEESLLYRDGKHRDVRATYIPDRGLTEFVQGLIVLIADITEEKKLREATLHLAAIVQSSEDAIISKDLNGIITSWNQAAEKLLGYSSGEAIGKPIAMLAVPDRADEMPNILNRIRRGDRVEHFQTIRRHKDGRRVQVSLTVSPILDPVGRVIGASKILRDVSERNRLEGAIRASEQESKALEHELLLLIEASGTLLSSLRSAEVLRTIVGLAQRFVKADAHAVWRMNSGDGLWSLSSSSGLSNASAMQDLSSNVPPDALARKPILVEDVEREPLLNARIEILRAEGIRSMLIIPLAIRGEVSGTVVFYWRAPHRLLEPEIRISVALGNLAASALGTAELYDRQLHLTAIAEASQKRTEFLAEAGAVLSSSLGYEKTLAAVAKLAVPIFADWCSVDLVNDRSDIRRVAVEHVDPERVRLAYKLMERYPPNETDLSRTAIRTGRSQLLEEITEELIDKSARNPEHAEMLRGLGLRSFILAPMLMGERVLGLITFATAESGRTYQHPDLALAEELARRAAIAIENSRLYEETKRRGQALRVSNVELRRANSDLEQFAYSASHDLKEPLRMVSLFTQLLEKKYSNQLDSEASEYIAHAVQGAQRMEMLVRDLLAYTTASASPGKPLELVNANTILEQTLGILHSDLKASGAEVTKTELPLVRIHAVQLHQLFQNLIGNAIKYRSQNAPCIHISAEQKQDEWLFAVQDNGIGIASEYAGQIFGLFKRLHGRDDYEGTGLGLAICKKIVESVGGAIWVESELGRGSTFYFTIPQDAE